MPKTFPRNQVNISSTRAIFAFELWKLSRGKCLFQKNEALFSYLSWRKPFDLLFQLRLHSIGTLEAAFFLASKLLKIFHSLWQNQLNIFLQLRPRGIVFFAAKTACPCKRDESKLGQSCDITPTSWHHPLPRSLHDWCWSYISGCDDTQQIAKWMWALNTRERYPISNGEQGVLKRGEYTPVL